MIMDEWHVGDPPDWGDHVGVPDIDYMGYINNGEDEHVPNRSSRLNALRREAWRLRNDGRLYDALDKINEALEYGISWRCLNVKAIILEDMGRRDEALSYYDRALGMTSSQLVKDNKARLLELMAISEMYSGNLQKPLDDVNQALKLTANDEDRCDFLQTKARILELMKRPREAYVCIKLANGQSDKVDEYESHSKILESTTDPIICIAGRQFHGHVALSPGSAVTLIKEPSNEHDPDAIRVEYENRTVGYVANSPNTLIDEASSATDIKNLFQSTAEAEVMFLFLEKYLLAKVIL